MSVDEKFASDAPLPEQVPVHIVPAVQVDIAAMAAQQGVEPLSNPDVLYGDFWPAEESTDDFIEWLRQSRRE
jgi:hypothetical protein